MMKQRGLWQAVNARVGDGSAATRLPRPATGDGALALGVAIPMSWAMAQGKVEEGLARVMTIKEVVFVMAAKRLGELE